MTIPTKTPHAWRTGRSVKASKQHFQLVEGVIRQARNTGPMTALTQGAVMEMLDSITVAFADAFERNNKSGFHRGRFLQGCGYRGLTNAERARIRNEENDE